MNLVLSFTWSFLSLLRQGIRQKEIFPEDLFTGYRECSRVFQLFRDSFSLERKKNKSLKSHLSRNLKSSFVFGGGKPSAMLRAFFQGFTLQISFSFNFLRCFLDLHFFSRGEKIQNVIRECCSKVLLVSLMFQKESLTCFFSSLLTHFFQHIFFF